jgi:hypothetical protein
VQAIIVNEATRTEAKLDMHLGALLGTSEDIFISQASSLSPLLFLSEHIVTPCWTRNAAFILFSFPHVMLSRVIFSPIYPIFQQLLPYKLYLVK